MENKHRKVLQRAFKIISPDFDPTNWSDQEFQTVFVNDVNFLLDHMVRRSKQIQDMKPKEMPRIDNDNLTASFMSTIKEEPTNG